MQAAEANLRIAQNQLRYTELVAPDDGVVTATEADPGQVVAAGQKVIEISRIAEREAVFAVAAEHVARATLGMPVKVWLQGQPDIAVTGSIREISPEADSTTGTYEVKVALPSPPAEMRLGAVVVGRAEAKGQEVMSVPRAPCCNRVRGRRSGSSARTARCIAARSSSSSSARIPSWSAAVCRPARRSSPPASIRWPKARLVKPETEVELMTRFNLSEWAVNNKAIVVFLMLLCAVAGLGAYERLGRQEDPDFSVQTMVVQVAWPGATAIDTLKQVTDRLEKKLEETPNLDYIKSYTKPGQATIFVYLKESTPKREIDDIWYQVRKKVSDIQATFPKGVVGPFFNDEFGDVFGIVYGITYDGFTPREARDFAETARAEFLRAPDVGKVEIFGDQDEKIYLDFSPQKLANLKLSLDDVLAAIAQQNAVVPSGVINTPRENVLVDVTGALLTPQSIANLNLWVNGRFYKLTDIAEVQRRLQRSAHQDVPRQRQARDRHRRQHARRAATISTFGEGLHAGGRTPDAALPGRHRAQARLRPARGRARSHRRASPRRSSRRSSSCSR